MDETTSDCQYDLLPKSKIIRTYDMAYDIGEYIPSLCVLVIPHGLNLTRRGVFDLLKVLMVGGFCFEGRG